MGTSPPCPPWLRLSAKKWAKSIYSTHLEPGAPGRRVAQIKCSVGDEVTSLKLFRRHRRKLAGSRWFSLKNDRRSRLEPFGQHTRDAAPRSAGLQPGTRHPQPVSPTPYKCRTPSSRRVRSSSYGRTPRAACRCVRKCARRNNPAAPATGSPATARSDSCRRMPAPC